MCEPDAQVCRGIPGNRVQRPPADYPVSTYIEDCGDGWLSGCCGRALVAQARSVLGLTPGDSRPLHFSLYVHPINFFGFSKRQDALSNNKAPWTQGPFLP